MNEAMLIGVAIGLAYAYLGVCLVVFLEDRVRALHMWVGASIPRGLLALVLWPAALAATAAWNQVARRG